MSESLMTFAGEFDANNEVAIFCALHSDGVSPAQQTRALDAEQPSSLIDIDQIVPEPSVSNISSNLPASSSTPPTPSSGKKDRRKFFSSLVSIRRKPKSDAHHGNSLNVGLFHNGRQRSASNAGSFVESLHSVGSHNTTEPQHHESEFDKPSNNFDLTSPSSPTSVHSASVRNAPSINESLTHMSSQQPPLILVDSEGYSIPPPDRTAWPHDANTTNDSLVDTDDMYSDAGSSMLSSPRIRVDIKNESVTEEDASQSAVALTRVATLLKEKNSSNSPTTRRLRGRREIRATQLYSVVEQDQIMSNKDELSNVTPSTTSSGPLLPNPFEMSQEKITEEEEKEEEKLPTIHVHTTETLHVISKGGLAEQSVVWGEISIEYDGPKGTLTPVCFKTNKAFDSLETTEYVDKLEDHDNVFKINTHLFHSEAVVCIKYQTKIDKERLPLVVKPMWKCEVDKSRLLIKYLATSPPLDNVVFVTMVTGNVQHASSIPDGELILAQKRMKWQLGRIDHPQESVIKAQFGTTEQGEPQPIAVRFEMKDQLLSDAYIEQGGESIPSLIWAKMGNSFKTIKTGKYVAEV
ncbi:hypothetical protein CU098_009356 [Rhizopus stolonifer]|uniref:MHD domain-containing protein n=1 Tax=Rhizopus stolonifer TaxID=4846 RepID=A0A367JW23_RHIST|nr:hypothetical protein CU098_009356 [Rhizopus stolonifer]